jgi:hypothetical protein
MQTFSSPSHTKNDQTSSALLWRLLPAGPTRLIFIIFRRARGLGGAPVIFCLRWEGLADSESVPELVRFKSSVSAPDCDPKSVSDSDGHGGIATESDRDCSRKEWDCVELAEMP